MKPLIAILCIATFCNLGLLGVVALRSDTPQEMFLREGGLLGGRRHKEEPECPGGKCKPHGQTPPVGSPGTPDFKPNPPDDVAPPAPPIEEKPSTPIKPHCPPPHSETQAEIEAMRVQINVIQQHAATVVGGMNSELESLRKQVADATAQANKPFWVRVVDPRGKYTTEPQSVRLGQQLDLKLEPIPSTVGGK